MFTICIPTKDRFDNLLINLRKLIPQLGNEVRLVVIDNCSSIFDKNLIVEICAQSNFTSYQVVRNKYDVGRNGNYIKCFEYCDTDWLYILGDSKLINSFALQVIRDYIQRYSDFAFINFRDDANNPGRQGADKLTTGLHEFIDHMDSFGNAMLLGACLFNLRKLKGNMHYMYTYGNTFIPYFVSVLMTLKQGEKAVYSSLSLIEGHLKQPAGTHWDIIEVNFGFTLLKQLPVTGDLQIKIGKKIIDPMFRSTNDYVIAAAFLMIILDGGNKWLTWRRYNYFMRSRYYLNGGMKYHLKFLESIFTFAIPYLGFHYSKYRQLGFDYLRDKLKRNG